MSDLLDVEKIPKVGNSPVLTYKKMHQCFNHIILKAIKSATGTSVIFSINISLKHFVFVLTSVPNVGERFTKT